MAVITQNPFETSFENMTAQAQGAAKQVQKSVGDTVKAVAGDVKEQVMGTPPPTQQKSHQQGQPDMKQNAEKSDEQKKQLLAQTRANLEKINQEIAEVRQKREKAYQERLKAEAQKKQEQKKEEQKKEEAPIWKQMLKKGSHEAMKNVAG